MSNYQFTSKASNASHNIANDLLKLTATSNTQSQSIASDLLALIGGGSVSLTSEISLSKNTGSYLSEIEQAILRSSNPINSSETEELTVIGQRGIWLNRLEANSWRGDIPIDQYQIYQDPKPQIISKKIEQSIEYIQELAIRYLRPPTPQSPGDIIITQEKNLSCGPAPPLIIRQTAARPQTPEPLIIREAPPTPPLPIAQKRITISGKRNPPPPRKVVIERLAQIPPRPQNLIIERWLPYAEQSKRRVIFNKAAKSPEVVNPRNMIIQWEEPKVNVKQEVKYLGVIRANPVDYVQKFGSFLKVHTDLPKFVLDIATPDEIGTLAADYKSKNLVHELEGDLEGFNFVDLDREGISEYRSQLLGKGIRDLGANSATYASTSEAKSSTASSTANIALKVFNLIDVDNSGDISIEEAVKILLKLNTSLKRNYGEEEALNFFRTISGYSNVISREQFVRAFTQLTD